jgi:membrane associated rhomboid family serine protease
MFAHDWTNNWHILGNMFTLYIFGRDVEGRLGPAEFLRFYLISGTIANIVFALLHIWVPDSPSALGASGAITAVVVLYICYFPHNILLVMFIIPMRAWVFGIIMIGMNMLGALGGRVGDTVQVAYDVHLSGAAIAFGYWHFRWNFGRIDPTQWLGGIQAWLTKPRLKIHKPSASEEELAAEADRILAKMHEQGESSLTARERKVLEDYSRQMRQKYR